MPIIPSNKSDFFNRTFSKKVKSNNRIIHWWQKITFSDQTTTTTATPAKKKQDWRHLSPNRPPLPFLYSLSQATSNRSVRSSPGSCNTVQSSIKLFDKISETEAVPSELAPIFKVTIPII